MTEFYLSLFIVACFCLLFWGLIRLERMYQYPFFMGAIFVSFIMPQAFALYNNPGAVSQVALARTFLMCCLCAAMCWIGYQLSPSRKWLNKLNIPLNEKKLFRAGIALTVIGYIFNILLWGTAIETAANSNWTGPSTIYIFFAQVLYIAFAIFLFHLIKRPNPKNFIFTAIAAYPILTPIILHGRRQPTMTFVAIVGLLFWFVRRYKLSRIVIISFVFLGAYLIPTFGQLRGDVWHLAATNDWQALYSSSQDSFNKVLEGDILELRNAALTMDAATRQGTYGYGTGYWDRLIFQYVPGQIVGHSLKHSLQFNWGRYYLSYFYNYRIPRGSTLTGIGDSFVEFDYFGCLVFAWIGFMFKNLWISSTYQKSVFSMLLYVGLISPAMVAITHGTGKFLQEAVFQLIFVGLVAYYSKEKVTS